MSSDPGADQRLERLRRFILLDTVISLLASIFCLMVYAFVERNGWVVVAAAMAAAAAAAMAMGLRPLAAGRASTALWWLVGANWAVAVATSFVATFAWPIQMMAAVLPVVVAVPYVSRRQFRMMIVGGVVVATTAAAVGLLQDRTGLSDAVPEWVADMVLIVFAPFMAVLVTQAGARTADTLRESLQLSVEANAELEASQRLLAAQTELLRMSRARIVAAADRERRRIERDLHDGAQQRLVGLSLQISLAREQVASDPVAAQSTLEKIRDEVRSAQEEMRALVRGLYPPVLTQHGLGPAVRAVVGQLDNPLRADVDDVERPDPEIEAAIYFLCVEAVQNILKHAGPTALVTVRLTRDEHGIELRVEDDGPGFDVSVATQGAGLVNMHDRIGAAGGSVGIVSAPGAGTRVVARVPCAATNPKR